MPRSLDDIRAQLGLDADEVELYGRNKAKVHLRALERRSTRDTTPGRLILVTAITPTPAGEGKTVNAIGLGDAIRALGHKTSICIRQPSLGPTFGLKGGGAGGGAARAHPAEDLNLHFTGDFHAVTSAHNLLAALADAHVFHGDALGFGPHGPTWNRVMDLTDRSLRSVVTGLSNGKGVLRETGFAITAASEVMAALAASRSLEDLRERLGKLQIGTNRDGVGITANDLGAVGAMLVLLKDAIHSNLIQSEAGTPLFAHMGPFGNLATGHNSVASDELSALALSDYVVTESGFGSNLGFEKFCHLVAPTLGRGPDVAVVVVTVRGLKAHSSRIPRLLPGRPLPDVLDEENIEALEEGAENLRRHLEIVRRFGVPAVVAINRFPADTDAELDRLRELSTSMGASAVALSEVYARGAEGGRELAEAVLDVLGRESAQLDPVYAPTDALDAKIEQVARSVYGAASVVYTGAARKQRDALAVEHPELPLCFVKTPFSLSHDAKLRGAPRDFEFEIDHLEVASGAGFIRVYSGGTLVMPGFGRAPSALAMDLDADGHVTGMKV